MFAFQLSTYSSVLIAVFTGCHIAGYISGGIKCVLDEVRSNLFGARLRQRSDAASHSAPECAATYKLYG